MYLLQLRDNDNFSLVEYVSNNVPRYAILSHTWGLDDEEVTFQDLKDGTGKSKAGYRKIRFCGKQAASDNLQHFWVDSCCINKDSSAELQEAINSMFRWYQNSERCYVYLSDVSDSGSDRNSEPSPKWKSAFKKSRWFSRGWTLQELIAPASVEFFSKEETRLGNKKTLEQTLHEITQIPIPALRGSPPSHFSIGERLSWAANRDTKRAEDTAYCLLGIFDVHIPLIYGEGRDKALKRLQKEITDSSDDASTVLLQGAERDSKDTDEEKLSKIRQWLSPPDPSINYRKALKQRQNNTGSWFLESEEYAKWNTDVTSPLWLYGIPGCGKTVLSCSILQNVLQRCLYSPGEVTAYFFFDFNDLQKQDPDLMLRSLLCQFSQQSIPASLVTLFSLCEDGQRQPSLDALLEVLQQIILEHQHVYVVLDALDECNRRADLMVILETIAGWQLENLHLLVTSRRERDIENSLEGFVDRQNNICLQSHLVNKDIQEYVRQRLSNEKSLRKWDRDPAIRREIETALLERAHGMFRWVVCQLDTLGECRNRAMLRESLATLPPTLDQTYDRILSAISEKDSKYAIRILRWLTFSTRSLSMEEVAELVAIDVERDPAFDHDEVLEDPLEALSICSSLVSISKEEETSANPVIQLAHYSVKEYLLSKRIQHGQAAQYSMQDTACHNVIAQGCVSYLLQIREPHVSYERITERYKLAWYAGEFWISHSQMAGEQTDELIRLAVKLLSMDNAAYLNWLKIHNPDQRIGISRIGNFQKVEKFRREVPSTLYHAALSGLTRVVGVLLKSKINVNAQGGRYGYALQAASERGYDQVVKMLLDSDAEVNAQGGVYDTALQAASRRGYENLVKILLDAGADVNAQGGYYGNALQAASAKGQEQVVKMLLDAGAGVNAQGGDYGNALQAASAQGQEQVVKMLLDVGADVNAQGGDYGNALQAASERGYEQVVKMLLDKGAKVNAQGGIYDNALYAASEGGHEKVVKVLLENDANVNARGGFYGNALQAASHEGHEQVVKILLDKGADVNLQGGRYGNALQAASHEGHEQVVKILLDKGADVSLQGGRYKNALHAASGHSHIVKMLLNIDASRTQWSTPGQSLIYR